MRPLKIAYYNASGVDDSLHPEAREPLWLDPQEVVTHLHGVGSTRSGKSKWLEWFCRALYREGIGFTVLDPQGQLSEDLIGWLTVMVPDTPVVYFDPNRSDYLVPFNPFRPVSAAPDDPNYLTQVDVRAKSQAAATLRVWNMEGSEHTPRLARWLYCLYYLFARGLLHFKEAGQLLSLSGARLREQVTEQLGDAPGVANEWYDLNQLKRASDFYGQIESTKNKLFTFLNQPQIRRLFAQTDGLNFDTVFRQEQIVICNLKPGAALHAEDARLLGALMVHDLWSSVERYVSPPNPRPYYLLIDEVQKFITPDLKEILDRGAGKGLRLGVFHQHLTQLKSQDQATFASITTNAKLKLAFGGLSYEDARLMVDELFTGQIDLKEVKLLLTQTKFWPTYDREVVRSRSFGLSQGTSSGVGINTGLSQGIGMPDANGIVEVMPYVTEVNIHSESSSDGSFEGVSYSEGMADVPIYRPVPFSEVSSVDYYSLEEQKEKLAGLLIRQYRRHLFIRVPGQDTVPALTPYVTSERLFPDNEARQMLARFIVPWAVPIANLDAALTPPVAKPEPFDPSDQELLS